MGSDVDLALLSIVVLDRIGTTSGILFVLILQLHEEEHDGVERCRYYYWNILNLAAQRSNTVSENKAHNRTQNSLHEFRIYK